MKISARIDYACRALFELSLHWPNTNPLGIAYIAEKQGIPIKFLTQILIALKQLGYTQSVRGKAGGYLLAKAPREIYLQKLLAELDDQGFAIEQTNNPVVSNDIIQQIWQEINAYMIKALEGITFETLINRQRQHDNVAMFEI
ncbi:MAG: Rrf2 family transcriptional regulator [Candidatus Omnitrophica bacterium]|nr:Rrf2 family transcriptional regulator [Candidatus Omnitrophota bacterium]MCB9747880.1 Rrf2 family transcriptional regulator [Candidatus Omnitrophota bacterium]